MAWSNISPDDLTGACMLVNQWMRNHDKEATLTWYHIADYYVAEFQAGAHGVRLAADSKRELYDLIHAYRYGLYALEEVK